MSSNEWAFMSGCCVCECVFTVIEGSHVYMDYFFYAFIKGGREERVNRKSMIKERKKSRAHPFITCTRVVCESRYCSCMLLANVLTYGTCRLAESMIKAKHTDHSLIRLHCEWLKRADQTAGEPCYVPCYVGTPIDHNDLSLFSSVMKK